jgi:hypothetical protein
MKRIALPPILDKEEVKNVTEAPADCGKTCVPRRIPASLPLAALVLHAHGVFVLCSFKLMLVT